MSEHVYKLPPRGPDFLDQALGMLPIPQGGIPYFDLTFSPDLRSLPRFFEKAVDREEYLGFCDQNGIIPFSRLTFSRYSDGHFSPSLDVSFGSGLERAFSSENPAAHLPAIFRGGRIAEFYFHSADGDNSYTTFSASVLPQLLAQGNHVVQGCLYLTLAPTIGSRNIVPRSILRLGARKLGLELVADEEDQMYLDEQLLPWYQALEKIN